MTTIAPWAPVLEGEELAYLGTEEARAGRTEPFPGDLDPRVASALVAQGITALWRHQAEAWEALRAGGNLIVTTGTASGKSLAFNLPGARPPGARPEEPRALPLPDEGTRAGPGAGARCLRAQGSEARDLRRRHGDGAALADPALGERHPDEPGHAPRRRPAAPRPLGRRAREPPLRRGRRGTRLPRRLRLARRERAAAAAAARSLVRVRAAVRARLRDDRQPRAAGRVTARCTCDRRRRRRGAACGADDRALEPGAPGRGARPARERARRCIQAARGLRRRRACARSASRRAARRWS